MSFLGLFFCSWFLKEQSARWSCGYCIFLAVGFLYYIHFDRWIIGIFVGNSAAWFGYLACCEDLFVWSKHREWFLSFWVPLLQSYSNSFTCNIDRDGVCCHFTAVASFPYHLFLTWLCSLCKSGMLSFRIFPKRWQHISC